MSIFDGIEKFITEHGSSAILSQQLSFAKDQFTAMEKKVSDLQIQIGRLEAQLERERLDRKQAQEDLQRLKDEHSEEICIHSAVEFRRGKRTMGQWMPFCPKCHMPAYATEDFATACSANCGWSCDVPKNRLFSITMQLKARDSQ